MIYGEPYPTLQVRYTTVQHPWLWADNVISLQWCSSAAQQCPIIAHCSMTVHSVLAADDHLKALSIPTRYGSKLRTCFPSTQRAIYLIVMSLSWWPKGPVPPHMHAPWCGYGNAGWDLWSLAPNQSSILITDSKDSIDRFSALFVRTWLWELIN